MTLPDRDVVVSWVGLQVVDEAGGAVGSCTAIYADDATGLPEWLLVQAVGDAGLRFLPLVDAQEDAGCVRVAFSADRISGAPRVGSQGHLTEPEEAELYRHYGVPFSADPSATLLPTAVTDVEEAPPTEPAEGLVPQESVIRATPTPAPVAAGTTDAPTGPVDRPQVESVADPRHPVAERPLDATPDAPAPEPVAERPRPAPVSEPFVPRPAPPTPWPQSDYSPGADSRSRSEKVAAAAVGLAGAVTAAVLLWWTRRRRAAVAPARPAGVAGRALGQASGAVRGAAQAVAAELGNAGESLTETAAGAARGGVRTVTEVAQGGLRTAAQGARTASQGARTASQGVRTAAQGLGTVTQGLGTATQGVRKVSEGARGVTQAPRAGKRAVGEAVAGVQEATAESSRQMRRSWRRRVTRVAAGSGLATGYLLGARAGERRYAELQQAVRRIRSKR